MLQLVEAWRTRGRFNLSDDIETFDNQVSEAQLLQAENLPAIDLSQIEIDLKQKVDKVQKYVEEKVKEVEAGMKKEADPAQPSDPSDTKMVTIGDLKYMKNDVYLEMLSAGAFGKLLDPQYCTEEAEIKEEWIELSKYLEKIQETNSIIKHSEELSEYYNSKIQEIGS